MVGLGLKGLAFISCVYTKLLILSSDVSVFTDDP